MTSNHLLFPETKGQTGICLQKHVWACTVIVPLIRCWNEATHKTNSYVLCDQHIVVFDQSFMFFFSSHCTMYTACNDVNKYLTDTDCMMYSTIILSLYLH